MQSRKHDIECTHRNEEENAGDHHNEAGTLEDSRVEIAQDADDKGTKEGNDVGVVEDVCERERELGASQAKRGIRLTFVGDHVGDKAGAGNCNHDGELLAADRCEVR